MEPNELIQNYVLKAYADIQRRADGRPLSMMPKHSNASLARKFPFVLTHLRPIKPNSLILDIGCGDNLYSSEHSLTIGMDVHQPRHNGTATAPSFAFVLADVTHPPFKKGLFDVVLLVSVLHHIPNEQMRAKCLRNCLFLATETEKSRIICVVWAKEQKAATFASNDVLVPYNLEDTHKLGHTAEIPFNRETTREQRIMMNAVPIRVKVPLTLPCPNYLPKSVQRRMLEAVSRVGWLYPMVSIEFYEQQFQLMANFIVDRLGHLKRIKDFALKNVIPSGVDHPSNLLLHGFAQQVSRSALDDAFAHLRIIYRDVLKYRYYHLFTGDELERLLLKIQSMDRKSAEFRPIVVEYEMGNWCAVFEKCAEANALRGERSANEQMIIEGRGE